MVHPANSYLDLAFLIPENPPPGWKPPKFLIFFDDITESIAVANFLRNRLPPEYRDMIKWFNSDMSAQFRDVESAKLKAGETWGLCCTDSFGMVRDFFLLGGFAILNTRKGDGLTGYNLNHPMEGDMRLVYIMAAIRTRRTRSEIGREGLVFG
jgi:superfamily II DNA/RNA helicase